MRRVVIFFLLLLSFGLQAQNRVNLTFGGTNRSMLVYVPNDLPENAPLVITLHGFNQSAQYQMEHTKWNAVADTAKFVVVYPDYEGGWWDVNGTKDTRFIEHIMDLMHEQYKVDLNRVYISGFSLGAMMTYHCIEVLANKVAAFAPVSGVRFDNKAPISARAVPIIHTHCKGDDVFKWAGDPNHASGGYPYIPDYVKSWADYFGLNPTPEVIDPYPANKSNSDADMTIYRGDDSVVEVRLLSFDGAGHWHVDADAWGGVSTTAEIWNFCKRYTLNLEEVTPPRLVSFSPEDKSFDLNSQGNREFWFEFDKAPLYDRLTAKLEGNGQTIDLKVDIADSPNAQGKFYIPEETEISDGDYTLTISGISPANGSDFTRSYSFEYTYGYEETGDVMNVSTVFSQDWDAMQKENADCLPTGWQRTLTKADGTTETVDYTTAPLSGASLKYIWEYGEITTAMLLTSTADYQSCNLKYGGMTDHKLSLAAGKYAISYNSAYWDKGAQRGKTKHGFLFESKTGRGGQKIVVDEKEMLSEGCAEGGNKVPVYDAAYHEYGRTVKKKDTYLINFNIDQGKKAVCIGNLKITTAPTNADRYKGEFLRLYKSAEELFNTEVLNNTNLGELQSEATQFKAVLDKYKGFSSTSPSAYTAAYAELHAAMMPFMQMPTSIKPVTFGSPISTTYYTIDGREIAAPSFGVTIRHTIYDNGKIEVKKVIEED